MNTKEMIIELINRIDNEDVLHIIFQFAQYLYIHRS